jgi:hypothetical protein
MRFEARFISKRRPRGKRVDFATLRLCVATKLRSGIELVMFIRDVFPSSSVPLCEKRGPLRALHGR